MHPTAVMNGPQATMADLRDRAQRGARARGARRVRGMRAHLNVDDSAQCPALFASSLQRSDAPGPGCVAEAIRATVARLGTDGCTGRMAEEFGDHPEAAAERMRWVRSVLGLTPS